MVGFRKGALGSPFSTEYQGDKGMEMVTNREDGPRIGPGYLKKVNMEVSKASMSKSSSMKKKG